MNFRVIRSLCFHYGDYFHVARRDILNAKSDFPDPKYNDDLIIVYFCDLIERYLSNV